MHPNSNHNQIFLKNKNISVELATDKNDNVEYLLLKHNDVKIKLGKNMGFVYGKMEKNSQNHAKITEIPFKFFKNPLDQTESCLEFLSMDPFFDIKLTVRIHDPQKINETSNNSVILNDMVEFSADIVVKKSICVNFLRFDFHYPLSTFEAPLDFAWVPHMRPEPNYIMGDHKFWAPVILLSKNKSSISLIPDVKDIPKNRSYKMHLDMDHQDNHRISYGYRNYHIRSHIMFESKKRDKIHFRPNGGAPLKIHFFMRLKENESKEELLDSTIRFLWDYFGRNEFNKILPQTIPFEQASDYSFTRMCDLKIFGAYQEFEYNGKPCAGFIYRSWTGHSRGKYSILKAKKLEKFVQHGAYDSRGFRLLMEKLFNSFKMINLIGKGAQVFPIPNNIWFWNQSWFLNVRTAYALRQLGRIVNNNGFKNMADRVINLAIEAPMNCNLFPSVAVMTDEGLKWVEGMVAFTPTHDYNIVDTALTCWWMLEYALKFDYQKESILNKLKKVAETLISTQMPSGAFPTLIKIDNKESKLVPQQGLLYETPGSSAIALFLCKLYKFSPNESYLESTLRVVDFLEKETLPTNKWYDYETFYSCNQYGYKYPPEKMQDPHTLVYPNNNLCIYWTAELLKTLYEITSNRKYLTMGVHILNYLLLWQQIWNPHFLRVQLFGGFGSQNSDAEWSDTRQGLFASTLLDYYLLTRDPMYLERGIAALKASYVMLWHEKNKSIAPGNFKWIKQADYGALPENYGHQGFDNPVPGILTIDWGPGTSCFGFVNYHDKIGDLFIDLEREHVYGINAILVKRFYFRDPIIEIDCEIIPEKKDILVKLDSTSSEIGKTKRLNLYIQNLNKKYEIELDTDSKILTLD